MVIEPWTCIFWATLCLTLPMNWLLSAIFAAIVHELGHYAALRWMGHKIEGLRISPGGIRMEVAGLSFGQELLCALAGPGASLLLVALYRWMPRISICALVQLGFNLLPMYPLDGGRGLRCVLLMLLPEPAARRMETIVQVLVLAGTIPVLFKFGLEKFVLWAGIFAVLKALVTEKHVFP